MNVNIASKCAECKHIAVSGHVYVCRQRMPMHRAFLTYGRPLAQGVPLVQRCKEFVYVDQPLISTRRHISL
jgi:hypothetical protein